MSADNWRICPVCVSNAKEERSKKCEKIMEEYGKIPRAEWKEKVDEAAEAEEKLEETLREDYELGIQSDGKFFISFGCSCKVCGTMFSVRHEEETPFSVGRKTRD